MSAALVQPVNLTIPRERLAAGFQRIRDDRRPNPLWHFELVVHKSSKLAPPTGAVPQPGQQAVSLALFHRDDPPCDIELLGHHLPCEIDPADWLDVWLDQHPVTPAARLRLPTLGGAVGDVVGSWKIDGAEWAGRFFCLKAGPRLVMLWARVAVEDYSRIAEEIFLAMSTFRFVDESPGPLAETVKWVSGDGPVVWKTAIPDSWTIKPEAIGPQVGSFQADLLAPPEAPPGSGSSPGAGATPGAGPGAQVLGKLSFAVLAADAMTNPSLGFQRALAAVRTAGVQVTPARPAPESSAPDNRSWYLTTAAQVNGQDAELRCRVVRHPNNWVVAAALSPARAAAPLIWMRTKRVLDIACATLETT